MQMLCLRLLLVAALFVSALSAGAQNANPSGPVSVDTPAASTGRGGATGDAP